MPITEILTRNAQQYGDDTALVELNPELDHKRGVTWRDYELVEPKAYGRHRREMSWREFDDSANRFANLLMSKGIKKGDRVAVLLMNCLEWLPIYFGILRTGALAVPLNFRYTADEIEYCLRLSQSDALVFGPEFVGRVELIYDQIPHMKDLFFVGQDCPAFADSYHDYDEQMSVQCTDAPDIVLADEDDAAIYFSSGTTGFPKAILHDHANLMASCATEQNHHGQTREDNFLCIPPLYHTGAKMHWFGSFLVGGKAVLLRGAKPEWIVKAISDEQATIVWLLVPWAQDILDAIDRGDIELENYQLDQLRLMHIGAQPVPPSLVRRWKEYFPHHQYDTNYGLSESIGPGCVHLGVENIHKVGAIGVPGYGWEVKIVDENGEVVKQGDVGELCVKGKGVMKCYLNDKEATDAVLKNGWLHTGDMARQDDDGFIFLVDRKKDVIISGGENIYPVQIEDFLRGHNAIKDVAVIGVADARLGEIALAVIEVKPGMTLSEEEVNEFCHALPRYKRPRKIVFAEVPRNPTGKIEKPKLREIYAHGSVVAEQISH